MQLGISWICRAGYGYEQARPREETKRLTPGPAIAIQMYRLALRCLPLAAALLCSDAFAQSSPAPSPSPGSAPTSLVHFGDIVDIDFVGSVEYDWRGGISPGGHLEGLDAVGGPIPALCRSEADIAADIENIYGKLLRSPKVVVRIVDRSNRASAVVDGAVRTPTRFRIQRPVRLRELIVRTGGFTDAASGTIKLMRPPSLSCIQQDPGLKDNTLQIETIKITDLLAGDAAANRSILSGDTVEVVKAEPVYVIGAVASPRPVYLRSEMTLSRAVASAGGILKAASGKVRVFRRQAGAEPGSIEADLEKIKRGETVDMTLMPFDIIDVAGKGGPTRKFPPFSSNTEPSNKRELPLRVVD